MKRLILQPEHLLGSIQVTKRSAAPSGSVHYRASAIDDGLAYHFPAGFLAQSRYLTTDFLLEGDEMVVFMLHLQEGEKGPKFGISFSMLNQCSARARIPLEAVNQNCWSYPREGAFLKPLCSGDVVDLRRVDRMTLTVLRKNPHPVKWSMTPLVATSAEPAKLKRLHLPKGPLLDKLGQSRLREWPQKSRSEAEVTKRIRAQAKAATDQHQPRDFSRWGGWKGKTFKATGYFRTQHDGSRWWLVDPDGCAFWSAGMDCVRFGIGGAMADLEPALSWLPKRAGEFAGCREKAGTPLQVDYLRANFIRTFGVKKAHAQWTKIVLSALRRLRFNTVANWSEWEIAQASGFPYVRPLGLKFKDTPMIFRDFPDVFHPGFAKDAAEFSRQLKDTRNDPALIGYFLMNEPHWGFAAQTPAEGMWLNTPKCATRTKFVKFLKLRGRTKPTAKDFADFSIIITKRLFHTLSDACRVVDPHHLNLGARYYTAPPDWALDAMKCFDVFSVNCYQQKVKAKEFGQISRRLDRPVIIGEWHFGALDAGLPATGIGQTLTQKGRGQAYRIYLEDAAAHSWCVGAHWFTLYDQSALGRFDGENYNIGFFDICHRPYEPLGQAARATHERIYRVAAGQVPPYAKTPKYLPPLFV